MKIQIKERDIEMYLIKRISVFLILCITFNAAYSQEAKCKSISSFIWKFIVNNSPKDISSDTTFYIYIDQNVVCGLAHRDSIKVDCKSSNINNNYYYMTGIGSFMHGDGFPLYIIYYPIPLKNNPLFKQACYLGDPSLASNITLFTRNTQGSPDREIKKYCILSYDGHYVNFAYLGENDGNLYAKYNPLGSDNGSTTVTMKYKKIQSWMTQELEKNQNKIFSITKSSKVYVIKSFSN